MVTLVMYLPSWALRSSSVISTSASSVAGPCTGLTSISSPVTRSERCTVKWRRACLPPSRENRSVSPIGRSADTLNMTRGAERLDTTAK